MSSSAQDAITASRRQAILLALYFQPGYTMARSALRRQIELIGYVTSSDLLASECSWLAEMGLVEQLELDAVRLTDRGEDVALGRAQTPGVRRPSPGETNGPR